jgi:hypothetical protein
VPDIIARIMPWKLRMGPEQRLHNVGPQEWLLPWGEIAWSIRASGVQFGGGCSSGRTWMIYRQIIQACYTRT